MSKYIKLTQGKRAVVDDEDFENLSKFKWMYSTLGYAVRRSGKSTIYMHRQVIKTPADKETDHINRRRLDNRKSNLRTCTKSENQINSKLRSDNTSGCRGVIWRKDKRRFQARIKASGKLILLGYFKDFKKAVKARKKAEIVYFGNYTLP